MMRRRFLVLAGSGLTVPLEPIRPAHATPVQVAALIAQLVGDAEIHDARVKLDLPVMVENGNSVSMTVSVDTPVGGVRSIDVFAEGNPLPHVLRVQFGPQAGAPRFTTRIRLATSQTMIAIAKLADGSCWRDSVDLLVTLAAALIEGAMVWVLINVPKQVKRGEPFDVKLLISHPMESGQRHDDMGQPIPRDIISSFVCTYNGEDVLRADLFPAIAANP